MLTVYQDIYDNILKEAFSLFTLVGIGAFKVASSFFWYEI